MVNLQLRFTDPLEKLPITNKKSEIVRSERSLLTWIRIMFSREVLVWGCPLVVLLWVFITVKRHTDNAVSYNKNIQFRRLN